MTDTLSFKTVQFISVYNKAQYSSLFSDNKTNDVLMTIATNLIFVLKGLLIIYSSKQRANN